MTAIVQHQKNVLLESKLLKKDSQLKAIQKRNSSTTTVMLNPVICTIISEAIVIIHQLIVTLHLEEQLRAIFQ